MTALRPATAPVEVHDAAENYGIDADRVLAVDGLIDWVRRRFSGRYAVDEFGGDPHLIDLVSRLGAPIRVDVTNAEHLPRSGPALLIANRGLGIIEPMVLGFAVRRAARRRLRVIGAPEVPVLGPAMCKLGAVGYRPDDVAALLRAGHLAAAPLAPTWLRNGDPWAASAPDVTPSPIVSKRAGAPPRELLAATLGFPVIPVAVLPGGPFGLPIRAWRVIVGPALLPPEGTAPDDLLAAAELAEEVRRAVSALLEQQ